MSKALVIIDVQKGMWGHPDYPPYDGDGVLDAHRRSDRQGARRKGAPIMYVQHHGAGDHPFQPGKPGYPFHDAIAPGPGDDVTVKTKSSAFHHTDFDAKLKARDIDHLIITGMQSEFCVNSAIRGAYERDYKITLVSDAHSTGDTRVAKAKDIVAIQNDTMAGDFAEVIPAAEIGVLGFRRPALDRGRVLMAGECQYLTNGRACRVSHAAVDQAIALSKAAGRGSSGHPKSATVIASWAASSATLLTSPACRPARYIPGLDEGLSGRAAATHLCLTAPHRRCRPGVADRVMNFTAPLTIAA